MTSSGWIYDFDVLKSYSTDVYTELFEADISGVVGVCAPQHTSTKLKGKMTVVLYLTEHTL